MSGMLRWVEVKLFFIKFCFLCARMHAPFRGWHGHAMYASGGKRSGPTAVEVDTATGDRGAPTKLADVHGLRSPERKVMGARYSSFAPTYCAH